MVITILVLLAASLLSMVAASSPCDIHVTNVTAISGIPLAFQCPSSLFAAPLTEYVPVTMLVTITPNPAAIKAETFTAMIVAGTSCTDYTYYSSGAYCPYGPYCGVSGYAPKGLSSLCVLITSAVGTNVTVNIDVEFTAASFSAQWHLINNGQFGGTVGNDVNATGAWAQGAYGEGVVIMIDDTGVQGSHVELADRFVTSLSWNPETGVRNPTPNNYDDDHGTACGGVAAAAINSYCGQGIAPKASIAGYRLFGENYANTVASSVRGLYYAEKATDGTNRTVSISSNSWGPGLTCSFTSFSAYGCYLNTMNPYLVGSIQYGADTGRDGKGVVYTFAAGNEGADGGDMNIAHYCKLPEVMCIAASDFNGKRVYYSNSGAGLFVNAPSQGQYNQSAGLFPSIVTAQFAAATTSCMGTFGGTSSSTPLVSGVIALLLGVRPDLTYRDVQHILQKTADRNDPTSVQWAQNGAGVWFSHHHGFGRVNAGNAVALAKRWSLIGGVCGVASSLKTVGQVIPDDGSVTPTPVTSTITWTAGTANLPDTIEHVMVYVTITHNYPFDLRIKLTSPSGTVATLIRPAVTYPAGIYMNYFTSYPLAARNFWGESPVGTWTITITDELLVDVGTFQSWAMEVQGAGNGTLPARQTTGTYVSGSSTLVVNIGMMVAMMFAAIIGVMM